MPASKKIHPALALNVGDHPELLSHGKMWDEFLDESDLLSLAPATRKVFLRFLNRANRSSLHPKDLRYFHEFVRYAHAHQASSAPSNSTELYRVPGSRSTKPQPSRSAMRTVARFLHHPVPCCAMESSTPSNTSGGFCHALRPNPSLKRSANGRPPGPVWRYAVHFRQPGPGVLPSSPA